MTDELAARGYVAVDADRDAFSEWVALSSELARAAGSPVKADRDWAWREDRIGALLSAENAEVLFVSGCAANMAPFLPQFDHIILLSAPPNVLVERLRTRTNNAYGQHPDEVARVLGLKDCVEPVLRSVAGHEIDTSAPLDHVVTEVLRLVQAQT